MANLDTLSAAQIAAGVAAGEFSAEDVGIASKSGTPVTVTLVNKVKSYTA